MKYPSILNYLATQGYEFHFKIPFQGIPFLDAVFVKKGFLDELNDKLSKIRSKRKSKKSNSTNSKSHVQAADCDST